MRIVFMGTSAFAVPSLSELMTSEHTVAAVVTQPDRPKGRGQKIVSSPVKEVALKHSLNIYQFDKIKTTAAVEKITELAPDLIVVVSYGQIIPDQVLNVPPFGCINVHASLLPGYRGAAPIQRALMAGEPIVGVSTMKMDSGLDTGDILMQDSVQVDPDMDHGQLESLLADRGAHLLLHTINVWESGLLQPRRQDHANATYAHRLQREDEIIDWTLDAQTIHNQVRALSPAPGAYTIIQGTQVKVYRTKVVQAEEQGTPGQLLAITAAGLLIQTGQGGVEILEVQKQGKKRMKALDFWQGMRLKPGIILPS